MYLFLLMVVIQILRSGSTQHLQARNYFRLCNINSIDFDTCAVESIVGAKKTFETGIPEIEFPSIQPLFVNRIGYQEGSGRLYLKHTYDNFTSYNMLQHTITEFKSDFRDISAVTINITIQFPDLRIKSFYNMEGRILIIPFFGQGECFFNMTDCTFKAQISGRVGDRDQSGQRYFNVSQFKIRFTIGNAQFRFDNLFNGNRFLGDATNNFMNRHWRSAYETYRHLPEKAFGDFFKNYCNILFSNFTFDELFLN